MDLKFAFSLTSFFLILSLVVFTVFLLEVEVLEAAGFFIAHCFLILSLVVGTFGTSTAESPESESGLYLVGPDEKPQELK